MRHALQNGAKTGRLHRLGVLPFHICKNVSSSLPYKQTAPLFKRPHYSRKSINDRCSQESGGDRGRKGIEMSFSLSFFLNFRLHFSSVITQGSSSPGTMIYLRRKCSFQEASVSWEVLLLGLS